MQVLGKAPLYTLFLESGHSNVTLYHVNISHGMLGGSRWADAFRSRHSLLLNMPSSKRAKHVMERCEASLSGYYNHCPHSDLSAHSHSFSLHTMDRSLMEDASSVDQKTKGNDVSGGY